MQTSLTLSGPIAPTAPAPPLAAPDGPICDITSSLTRARPATLWSLVAHGLLLAGFLGFQGIGTAAESPPMSIAVTLVAPPSAATDLPEAALSTQPVARSTPMPIAPPPAIEAPTPPAAPLPEMPPPPPLAQVEVPLPEAAPPPDLAALMPPPPPAEASVAEPITLPPPPKAVEPPKVIEKPPVKLAEKPPVTARAKPAAKPAVTPVAASQAEPPAAIATGPAAAPTAPAPADQMAMAAAPTVAPMPKPSPLATSGELALSAPPIILEPKPLVPPQKNYPKLAIKMGQQGIVQLAVDIDETGKVLDSLIRESSGFPLLDRQAQIDVKTAVFSPYHFNGRAVRHTAYLPMKYELK